MTTLNGKPLSLPRSMLDVSLLDYLRDHAHLKGTKFGCGQGLCGACTVNVDGTAERSCQLNMSDVLGHDVTTIEGLSATVGGDKLHPVQQAWIDEAVPQCGYCQPGQIMAAVALLRQNASPDDADINDAMRGNICRCGTYDRIRRAISRAAAEA